MSALTRVYLSLSKADLQALCEDGRLSAEVPAAAVTTALEQANPGEDHEGWEFLALCHAAADRRGPHAVVGSADVPTSWVQPAGAGATAAAVTITGVIERRQVVSLHVGEPAAAGAPESDGPGVEEDIDLELSWYDITELPLVVALLEG